MKTPLLTNKKTSLGEMKSLVGLHVRTTLVLAELIRTVKGYLLP